MSSDKPRTVASPPAPPRWRQGYDALESIVGPPLEQWVHSDNFAIGLGLVSQLRREFERRAGRATRQLLHRFNLPAGTDVTRLLVEIGELRKQVRQLTEQLTEQLDSREHPAPRAARLGGRHDNEGEDQWPYATPMS